MKYYAVRVGKKPGIYTSWDDCKAVVHGYPGAIYKSFTTEVEAREFVGTAMPKADGQMKMDVEDANSTTEENKAVAYVDGSYQAATGEYSCGVVFMTQDEELTRAMKGEDESLASMRNVAGEILGAQVAMKMAIEMGIKKLDLYHDYQGIASWCTGEWKTNKEGTKAYKEYYDSISSKLQVNFCKVKGHSGDKYNDMADELARSALGI